MTQKKSINFGFRGWMLIFYSLIANLTYVVFNNYPMNILSQTGFYPDATSMSTYYLLGSILAIIVQLILSNRIGKIKSVWGLSIILGLVNIIFSVLIITLNPANATIWLIVYGFAAFVATTQAIFTIGIVVGQWFPRRIGTAMGVSTLAFPIAMGIAGYGFAAPFFAKFGAANRTEAVATALKGDALSQNRT